MPEFDCGSSHIARARLRNSTSGDLSYNAELYLVIGDSKQATSGLIDFSIPAGQEKSVDFPVTMPDTPGTYQVYLDIWVGNELIIQGIADPVTVSALPNFEVNDLRIEPSEHYVGQPVEISVKVMNVGLSQGSYTVQCALEAPSGATANLSKTVTLDPNQSQQVTFTMVANEAGTHLVYIDGLSASFEVLAVQGRLTGYITNADTGAAIPGASVFVDGAFDTYSDSPGGGYLTGYYFYGLHIVTVVANNCMTTDFNVDLQESLLHIDFQLHSLTPVDGWPADVEITEVTVSPTVVNVGETVTIKVAVDIPYPIPLPYLGIGTVYVNGTAITREWSAPWRNPYIPFEYVATTIGTFTAVARDKSAIFEVRAVEAGKFYDPYGRIFTPKATKVLCEGEEMPVSNNIWWTDHQISESDVTVLECWPSYVTVTEWTFSSQYEWLFDSGWYNTITPVSWTPLDFYFESEDELASVLGPGRGVLCPYCGRRFSKSGWTLTLAYMMIDHIKTSHPLSCPYCETDMTFCTSAVNRGKAWIDHLREAHGIEPPEVNITPLYETVHEYYSAPVAGYSNDEDYLLATGHHAPLQGEVFIQGMDLIEPSNSAFFDAFNATIGVIEKGYFVPRLFRRSVIGALKLSVPCLTGKSWTCQIAGYGTDNVWGTGLAPEIYLTFQGEGDLVKIESGVLPSHSSILAFVFNYDNQVLVIAKSHAILHLSRDASSINTKLWEDC